MKNCESGVEVKWNVEVVHRKFISDPEGSEVGAADGSIGRYEETGQKVHNLLTSAGRDFLHLQGYETTGLGANGGNYIALTTDSGSPATADTTLATEITTGGLGRAQGTVSHSAGETTSSVQHTFTASDTHTDVQKSGLFNASTGGTLMHEATFTPVTLENNDQLQVTWTITLS